VILYPDSYWKVDIDGIAIFLPSQYLCFKLNSEISTAASAKDRITFKGLTDK